MKRLINNLLLKLRGVRIVSYPRSGRTWLRLMLHDLGVDPRFTHVGSKNILHLPPSEIGWGMERYHRRRIIFLHREPRDVLVSYFHHVVRQGRWDGDLPTFIRDPENGFERILAFNLLWLDSAARFRDFMVINYEVMRADPRPDLLRIARFLRCGLVTEADIDFAIANNSFERMKTRERSGELRDKFGDRFTSGEGGDEKMIVRRGKIGGHSDELTAEDRAYCDELLRLYDYEKRIKERTARINSQGAPG